MSVLDQVMELKSKGATDSDIITSLREQGVSPKSINDALGQARIKGAVSSQGQSQMDYGNNQDGMSPSIMRPENAEELPTEGSISDEDLTPLPSGVPPIMQQMARVPLHRDVTNDNNDYVPSPQGQGNQQNQQQQQQYNEYQPAYPQQYQYQPQEYIPQDTSESMYQPGSAMAGDTDTIIEISEQVFAERMKGAVKQIDSFNEFKTLAQSKIDNISERMKRIESTIDSLQIAILEKVGSYGRGLDSIKKEMEMMQDSFAKVIGKAVSNQTHEHTHHHTPQSSNSSPTIQRIEKRTTVVHKSSKKGKKHSKK